MESLKIQVPKGFEIDQFDAKKGLVTFKEKPKCIMERIKTIDDVFKWHETTQEEFNDKYEKTPLEADELYYILLKMIVEALNEGWKPDWSNSSEYKYYPWFEMASSGFRFNDYDFWYSFSFVGSRLCFKSRELAEYAGKTFLEEYKKYMLINK